MMGVGKSTIGKNVAKKLKLKFIDMDRIIEKREKKKIKEIFSDNRREYGGGLKKFEPNDLNRSKMLDLSLLKESIISKVLKLYLEFKQSKKESLIEEIDTILRGEFSKS